MPYLVLPVAPTGCADAKPPYSIDMDISTAVLKART